MNRRYFLKRTLAASLMPSLGPAACAAQKLQPNIILIFCDDLGYGDIGCFGSQNHRTPNVDRMAAEGIRLTSFYVTSGVCTPSRSSLMTGCYPRRVNLHENSYGKWVLFPAEPKGLHPEEITIAEILKSQRYATACVGKWHLGDQPEFLPTRQGFDEYYGIPYSNDMGGKNPDSPRPPLPLLRGETVIEAPADQASLTQRYTQEALRFINANKDSPFFLYLPHTMPHLPIHASDAFRGQSANGIYGDAVEEIDWSTGRILDTLQELGLTENTLVIFTSDNGAALREGGGSNAPLSGGKGSTHEGGMRVPCVMRWPQRIPAGLTCDALASTIDLLPTFAHIAGGQIPSDRIIDGKNILSLLEDAANATSPHEAFYYYFMDQLQAVRSEKWKLVLPLEDKQAGWNRATGPCPAALYDLDADIGETTNIVDAHPEIAARLTALAEKARADLGDAGRPGQHQRPAGMAVSPVPLRLAAE